MEELVNLVVKKTGLPKEMAQKVVKVVVDYLKKKLPAPFGSQLELFLKNEAMVTQAGNLLGGLAAAVTTKKKK